MRGLDLCAGCGIIGLDLLFHLQNEIQQPLRTMDFLEVQEIYRSHFEINVSRLGATSTQIKFISANYERLQNTEFREAFDLIVCNPPYFFKNQGKLSPSEFKNRCRFFIDSTFNDLILGIANALSVCGNAYVLLRDLPEHGWKATEAAIAILGSSFEVKAMGEIRGTPWVRIGRQSHPPHVF
jgi:tRNA1(Val) A37 N6-methylase TrmN6